MEKREWKEAEDTFKELRSEGRNKNDAFACLAQGAIPLNSLSGRRKVGSYSGNIPIWKKFDCIMLVRQGLTHKL